MLSRLLMERRGGGAEFSAFWMISGSWTPDGSARPRPAKIRMVRVPERNVLPSGRGVVGREGIGVTEREAPASLVSVTAGEHKVDWQSVRARTF